MSAFQESEHPRNRGRFAAKDHAEDPGVALDELDDGRGPLIETAPGRFEVASASIDRSQPGRITLSMLGEPHRRAQNKMAALAVRRLDGSVDAKVDSLARSRAKATVLVVDDVGDVDVKKGTISVPDGDGDDRGAAITFRKKSSWVQSPSTATRQVQPVAVVQGTGGSDVLVDQFDRVKDRCPTLERATTEDLPIRDDDDAAEPPSDVAAVYVLDHPGFGEGTDGTGAVFFATDQEPADPDEEAGRTILNGYLVVPQGSGLTSEHGSFYADDVDRWGGRVSDYEPGTHTFADAMAFGDVAGGDDNDIEACWEAIAATQRAR